jgi:hypothetical protein
VSRRWTLHAPATVTVYVLVMAALTQGYGYRHAANFLEWRYDYYAAPAQREANAAATGWLREHAPDGRVAAQDRPLPQVASRRYVYRLEQWEQTDWVLLAPGQDAWPYAPHFARDLDRRLARSPEWSLAFESGDTRVYRRAPAATQRVSGQKG